MTKSARCFTLITSVLVTLSVTGLLALPQQRPAGQAAGSVIVDFVAVGANGQPVADLQPADVSIRISGKQRTITKLDFVKVDTASGPASTLPPPFAVNTPSTGRSLLILIDNESLRAGSERTMKESLDSLLKGLGPADRVALSVAPRDSVQLGFGAGLPAVRAALAKITGVRPANVSDSEAACRSRDSLVLLRSLLDSMAGSETPTSVLYVAGSLTVAASVNRNVSSGTSCEVLMEHYQGVGSAAAAARANVYVVQGDDAITMRDSGLDNLAGLVGTPNVLRAMGDGLNKVLTESAGYYLATVQPDPADRPGQSQRLEVRVGREGVTAHARSEVVAGRGGRAGAKATPRDMVATTAPFTDLHLRATAIASRGQGGKMTVLALAEPVDPSVKLSALTAVIVAPGAAKAAFVANADEKQLALRPVVVALAADPGKYRLRVAAVDSTGRAGAVDYDLDANFVEAGPIKVAGLLIAGPRGEGFAPQLVFSNEPELALQVDLFGDLAALKMGAKFEIAATPDGKALAEGQVGGAGTSEPDKFVLSGRIPIASLAPGDYVVRVTVQAEGHPEAKLIRTIRKVAK